MFRPAVQQRAGQPRHLSNKLYKQLTSNELANLAIDAMVRLDFDEQEIIFNSVERRIYKCVHEDYQNKVRGFERLALFYGVNYWMNHATLMTAMYFSHADTTNEDKTTIEALSNIASMELALIDVCKTKELDIKAVKWLAIYQPLPVKSSSSLETPELISEYSKLLSACFKSGKVAETVEY